MKSLIIKIITTVVTALLFTGCYTYHKPIHTKHVYQKTCYPGDKEATWNELLEWKNVMYNTRRNREKYCVTNKNIEYLLYCINIEKYHTKVEKYVTNLQEKYDNICKPKDLF